MFESGVEGLGSPDSERVEARCGLRCASRVQAFSIDTRPVVRDAALVLQLGSCARASIPIPDACHAIPIPSDFSQHLAESRAAQFGAYRPSLDPSLPSSSASRVSRSRAAASAWACAIFAAKSSRRFAARTSRASRPSSGPGRSGARETRWRDARSRWTDAGRHPPDPRASLRWRKP
jgi:hypothetical protein